MKTDLMQFLKQVYDEHDYNWQIGVRTSFTKFFFEKLNESPNHDALCDEFANRCLILSLFFNTPSKEDFDEANLTEADKINGCAAIGYTATQQNDGYLLTPLKEAEIFIASDDSVDEESLSADFIKHLNTSSQLFENATASLNCSKTLKSKLAKVSLDAGVSSLADKTLKSKPKRILSSYSTGSRYIYDPQRRGIFYVGRPPLFFDSVDGELTNEKIDELYKNHELSDVNVPSDFFTSRDPFVNPVPLDQPLNFLEVLKTLSNGFAHDSEIITKDYFAVLPHLNQHGVIVEKTWLKASLDSLLREKLKGKPLSEIEAALSEQKPELFSGKNCERILSSDEEYLDSIHNFIEYNLGCKMSDTSWQFVCGHCKRLASEKTGKKIKAKKLSLFLYLFQSELPTQAHNDYCVNFPKNIFLYLYSIMQDTEKNYAVLDKTSQEIDSKLLSTPLSINKEILKDMENAVRRKGGNIKNLYNQARNKMKEAWLSRLTLASINSSLPNYLGPKLSSAGQSFDLSILNDIFETALLLVGTEERLVSVHAWFDKYYKNYLSANKSMGFGSLLHRKVSSFFINDYFRGNKNALCYVRQDTPESKALTKDIVFNNYNLIDMYCLSQIISTMRHGLRHNDSGLDSVRIIKGDPNDPYAAINYKVYSFLIWHPKNNKNLDKFNCKVIAYPRLIFNFLAMEGFDKLLAFNPVDFISQQQAMGHDPIKEDLAYARQNLTPPNDPNDDYDSLAQSSDDETESTTQSYN